MIQPQGGIGFQFHKGTIKPIFGIRPYRAVTNFNSIKVRLNRELKYGDKNYGKLFQFHKGTIKPPFLILVRALLRYFNSIKVRLNLP